MQLLLICWRMDAAISQRLKCKSKRLMANATQPTKRTVSAATDTLNIALYQVEIHPADGYPDRSAERVLSGMREAGIGESATAKTAHGFLVQGRLSIEQVSELASQVLSDSVVQQVTVGLCGGDRFTGLNSTTVNTLYVLPKAGVTDPEAETALRAVQQLGFPVDAVRTFRKYVFTGLSADEFQFAKAKYLTNQSIEQAVDGGLQLRELQVGQPYKFELIEVPLRKLAGQDLDQLSQARTLSLTRVEMEQIQSHFVAQGREPTDIELDTIAQTWSEHCSHKTLAGRIQYRDENAGALRQDWPRIPLPATRELLEHSAALGEQLAALMDVEKPVPGVTTGKVREDLREIAVIARVGGGALDPAKGELALTAGWGHGGKGGVTMPGKGRVVMQDAVANQRMVDVYLNGLAYWKNIPEPVWEFTLGGYQVMKKWLSYRERTLLGRDLTMDEARYFTEMARRIAAIVSLGAALDANYQAVKANTVVWPQK